MIARGRHQDRPQPRAARLDDRLARSGTPRRAQHVGVVHLQNRVLLDDAEEEQDAERAPQIQRAAGRPDREQRERHRQRQHRHDDDRLDEALELRRQHHVDEDAGQRRSPCIRLSVVSSRLLRLALHAARCSRAACAGRRSAGARRSTPRRARGQAPRRRCSSIANCRLMRVILRRPEAAVQLGDVVDAHRPAGRRRHRELADRARCRGAGLRARGSSPDTARRAFAIARDLVVAGHHQPQRVADRRHPDAEIRGARAIDRDVHLRAGVAVVGPRVDEARRLLAPSRAAAASSRTACRCPGRAGSPGSAKLPPPPPPSGLRGRDDRRQAGMPREDLAHAASTTSSCVTFRSFDRQQIEEHVEVVVRGRRPPGTATCDTPSWLADLLDDCSARSRSCPRATCPAACRRAR